MTQCRVEEGGCAGDGRDDYFLLGGEGEVNGGGNVEYCMDT